MVVKVSAILIALAGVLVWQLGLFDRPKFEYQETLLDRELYAIVATTKGNVGKQVAKIAEGTLKGIESLPNSKELFESAAKLYPGTPEGAEKLALGLYFDDPKEVPEGEQRWALGWAVESPKGGFGKIRSLVDKVQEASGLSEPIRAVRISKGRALKGEIPWRNFFTPMVQPRIQWNRAFQAYEKGGFEDPKTVYKGPIALEVYVTGVKDSFHHIDYVVLFDNTKHTWDDCFPEEHVIDASVADE